MQFAFDQELAQKLNECGVFGLFFAPFKFRRRVLDFDKKLLVEEFAGCLRDLTIGVVDEFVKVFTVFVF